MVRASPRRSRHRTLRSVAPPRSNDVKCQVDKLDDNLFGIDRAEGCSNHATRNIQSYMLCYDCAEDAEVISELMSAALARLGEELLRDV